MLIRFRYLSLFMLLAFFNCTASSTTGSDSGSSGRIQDFTSSLGQVYQAQIGKSTLKVFTKYAYETDRIEGVTIAGEGERARQVYIETLWKNRPPEEDEKDLGYVRARTKIYIKGRPVVTQNPFRGDTVFRMEFSAQNQVQTTSDPVWRKVPNTPMYTAYITRILNELKTEYGFSR